MRLPEVPADAGKGFGLFEILSGVESGDEPSRELKARCGEYYGTLGRAWIEYLANRREEASLLINSCRESCLKSFGLPDASSGQVKRVASQFAILGAVGEVATEPGITGWSSGEAFAWARACFELWLQNGGSTGDLERSRFLSQVRLFLEQHGDSRFTFWSVRYVGDDNVDESKTVNRAGCRRNEPSGLVHYIFPEVSKVKSSKDSILDLPKPFWTRRVSCFSTTATHHLR